MKNCLAAIGMFLFSVQLFGDKINVTQQMNLAEKQYSMMLQTHNDVTKIPYSTSPDGTLKDIDSSSWCSGFFPGALWYLYEYSKDQKWKKAAEKWTMALKNEQFNTGTHDLGFMLYCSFGNGYRLTKNPVYKKILLQGAKSLATRFDPKVGVIKSWNEFDGYNYPVIIDNMMNLKLLMWASKISGDNTYSNIAVMHADKTLKNHFRADYSSYHVVAYDSTGNVIARKTAQGAADESAWARGQAWSLYGFTMMYRETGYKCFLDQAIKIADFFIHNPSLPADKIPYWDFNAPKIPNEERDASAAAIAASALLELSNYADKNKKEEYINISEEILQSLSSPSYRSAPGENNNFLLKHSVAHKPAGNEVDKPLVYADYYYLEALLRYSQFKKLQARNKSY